MATRRLRTILVPDGLDHQPVGGPLATGGDDGGTGSATRSVSGGQHSLKLKVRGPRVGDLPSLVRLSSVRRLNEPELTLTGHSLTRSAVRSFAPLVRSRPFVAIAEVDARVVGAVQFEATGIDRRWHAVAIGTSTGVYDPAPVEDDLLRYAITSAGLRGVKRLFARVPSGLELVESFQRAGFTPYATETIFVADSPRSWAVTGRPRRQESSDTWAIHQLHNATVPRQVQYAEAITSHEWDVRGRAATRRPCQRSGWLVDDGALICAYGRVAWGDNTSAIELLYLPERMETLGGLIDYLLNQIHGRSRRGRIYCTLRGYQVDAVRELEHRGFEPILEQDLLVRYTTAAVRSPQTEPVALHTEVIDRLPKRVPSFLQTAPKDERAG